MAPGPALRTRFYPTDPVPIAQTASVWAPHTTHDRHSNDFWRRHRHCTFLLATLHSLSDHFLQMLPHFLCVALGLAVPFAVRHGLHTLRKMDRFLVRIVNTTIAVSLCAIRAGSSFAKRLSFA